MLQAPGRGQPVRLRRLVGAACFGAAVGLGFAVVVGTAAPAMAQDTLCTRDGTSVLCHGAEEDAGVTGPIDGLNFVFGQFGDSSGVSPSPVTTFIEVLEIGNPTINGTALDVRQTDDITIRVDGRHFFLADLEDTAGSDGQLTVGEYRALVARVAAGPGPALTTAEIDGFVAELGTATGQDTTSDATLVSADDVLRVIVATVGAAEARQEFEASPPTTVGRDEVIAALQISGTWQIPNADVESFVNNLFATSSTITTAAAGQAVQDFLLNGGVGSLIDNQASELSTVNAQAQPSGGLGGGIVAISERGAIDINSNAHIIVSGSEHPQGITARSGDSFNSGTSTQGGAVTVVNHGNITVSGTQPVGIEAWSGNPGFEGANPVLGSDVSVENYGDITIADATRKGSGISVTSNGGNVDVINEGDISASGESVSGIEVEAYGAGNLLINNSGTITSSDTAINVWTRGIGDITILNAGDLHITDSHGGIFGKNNGAGTIRIDNSGDIVVDGSDSGGGIKAESDGLGNIFVDNSGDITVNLSRGVGIEAWTGLDDDVTPGDGNTTIANTGRIQLNGDNSQGISAGSPGQPGTTTVTTSGNVIAGGADSVGILAGSTQRTVVNVESGATVQGGSGSTNFNFSTALTRTPVDDNGDGITDYIDYDDNGGFAGSAGVMMWGAAGGSITLNNAGTITALNGQAIAAFEGQITNVVWDWDNIDWGNTDPSYVAPTVTETDTFEPTNDTVTNEGSIIGNIVLGGGNNTLTNLTGGVIVGNLTTGVGIDTVNNFGTITGNVDLGAGDDTVTMDGGTITGNVSLGAGDDTVALSNGAVITGVLDGGDGVDQVDLIDASIGSVINVETLNIDGASGAYVLSGSQLGATGTISIDNIAMEAITFTGGAHVDITGGAEVSLAAGNHDFSAGSLVVGTGSTLKVTSGRTTAQNITGGGATTRVNVAGGTLDMRDGAANDVLVVAGAFNPTNATVLFDVSRQAGADRVEAQTSAPINNRVGLNFYSGDVTAATGTVALVQVDGETAPAAPAEIDEAPDAHSAYKFQSNPSSIFRQYYLVAGASNGLYLVWTTQEAVSTNVPAINEAASESVREGMDQSMERLLDAEINGAPIASRQISPSFRLWSSGRLAYTDHSGFDLTSAGGTSRTAPFTSIETSFMGSAQLDIARLMGWDNRGPGFKVGVIAGVSRADIEFDATAEQRNIGITSAGSGSSQSFVAGSYFLATLGNFYGVISGNGTWGENDVSSALLDADSNFSSVGYSGAVKLGMVLPVTKRTRVDLRGGVSFGRTVGEAHVDTGGNVFEESILDTAHLSGSATFYTVTRIADINFKPFVQVGAQQRIHYDNHVEFAGQKTSFEDDELTGFGRIGLNAALTEWAILSAGLRGDINEDFWSVSGNLGIKWKLN